MNDEDFDDQIAIQCYKCSSLFDDGDTVFCLAKSETIRTISEQISIGNCTDFTQKGYDE